MHLPHFPTYSNVSRAEYDFDESEFDEITESAKDFISSLLVKDAKKRLSSEEALEYVVYREMFPIGCEVPHPRILRNVSLILQFHTC